MDAGNDLASGIGAFAGTVVGGVLGGAPGAGAGAVVGKIVGSLFVLEVGMREERIVLDVPQVAMRTQDFSFDLPSVTMRDKEIIFGVPGIEMRREKGPPIPETIVEWEVECVGGGWLPKVCTKVPKTTVRWSDTWIDIPVPVMKEVRIVIGVPEIAMDRQEIAFDIPEFKVEPTEVIFSVPTIALRFVRDAGRRAAAQAAALAQSAQEAASAKQLQFKAQLRSEVTPLAIAMFSCYRKTVEAAKLEAGARFDPEIEKLSRSVTALTAQGVPADNPELAQARTALEAAIAQRDAALKPFDDALAQLDKSARETLDQFLDDVQPPAAEAVPPQLAGSNDTTPMSSGLITISVPA